MTLGERAVNWSKALVTIWPIILMLIGGTVYGNVESVRTWIHGPDEIAPVQQTYSEAFDKINKKFAEQDQEIKKLKSRDFSDQQKIQKQIDHIRELVQ